MSTGEIVAIVEDRFLDDPIYKLPDGSGKDDGGVGVGVGTRATAGQPAADPAFADENATLVRSTEARSVSGRREMDGGAVSYTHLTLPTIRLV